MGRRGLTRAERLVVEAVLRGARNSEIARERGTSERTIANQVASAYKKLGVRSRLELARLGATEKIDAAVNRSPAADGGEARWTGSGTAESVVLKPRELVVLGRRLQGDRLSEIAAELGLSVSSASRLAQRAVSKLGARSLIELSCQGFPAASLVGREPGTERGLLEWGVSAGDPSAAPGSPATRSYAR